MYLLVTGIFHGILYIKMQSKIEEMYAYTRIYSISTVCATITIKMATKLSDQCYLNPAVTLTSKFEGQMINCLCLKNAWPDLHETKTQCE